MTGLLRFLGGEAEEQGQISDGACGQLLFVKGEELREVTAGSASFCERVSGDILQAKFDERPRQGARESGRLSDWREIWQIVRSSCGLDDASGQRLDPEPRDGCEAKTAHKLRSKVRGELGDSQGVKALATGGESMNREFVGGGSCGRNDEDFTVTRLRIEEHGGAIEQSGVGA